RQSPALQPQPPANQNDRLSHSFQGAVRNRHRQKTTKLQTQNQTASGRTRMKKPSNPQAKLRRSFQVGGTKKRSVHVAPESGGVSSIAEPTAFSDDAAKLARSGKLLQAKNLAENAGNGAPTEITSRARDHRRHVKDRRLQLQPGQPSAGSKLTTAL